MFWSRWLLFWVWWTIFGGVASRLFMHTAVLCYIWFDRVLDGGRWLWWVVIMDRGLAVQKRLKTTALCKSVSSKTFNLIWMMLKILKKNLIANSSSGSNGWDRVKRERTKSRERVLLTIVFDSGHLQHESERPDMERKYVNSNKAQRTDPKLTTIISEMRCATNIQSNQACILQYYKS